jgi:hypothetical protein
MISCIMTARAAGSTDVVGGVSLVVAGYILVESDLSAPTVLKLDPSRTIEFLNCSDVAKNDFSVLEET